MDRSAKKRKQGKTKGTVVGHFSFSFPRVLWVLHQQVKNNNRTGAKAVHFYSDCYVIFNFSKNNSM